MLDFLTTLAAMTLGGSAAILLFAFAARAFRTRYGARWRCWIWVLLCLRMVIPFSLVSLIGESRPAPIQISTLPDTVIYEYTPPEPGATQSDDSLEDVSPNSGAVQTPPAVSVSPDKQTETQDDDAQAPSMDQEFTVSLSQIILIIWLAGIAVFAVWTIVSHMRFLRYLRRWRQPVQEPDTIRLYNQLGDQLKLRYRPSLYTCDGLHAPMLAGLIHPVLLLPEGMLDGNAAKYALLHELTHYKRRDIWLKTLALAANIIHWFNPFMWYMVRLVERDTELACDEAALRRLPPEEHAAYGRTILSVVERLKSNRMR